MTKEYISFFEVYSWGYHQYTML